MGTKNTKVNWQPLRELALHTPYTMGYLSLMARRKQLKVKKIGRIWYSTMENIRSFEKEMEERKEKRKKELQDNYREKVRKEVLEEIEKETEGSDEVMSNKVMSKKVMSKKKGDAGPVKLRIIGEDTIFDEVQKELQEVLQEIREKEKRIKLGFLAYQKDASSDTKEKNYPKSYLSREKKETEEISEKLIMDLGRLINVANEVHEDKIKTSDISNSEGYQEEAYSIPVKKVFSGGTKSKNIDLKRKNLVERMDSSERSDINDISFEAENFIPKTYNSFPFERNYEYETHDSTYDRQNNILLVIAGTLIFIATILLLLFLFL